MVTELDHYKPNFKIQAARIRGHADYAGVALRPLGGLFGPPAAADRRTNIPGQPDNVPRSTRNNEKLSLLHDASQICCRELGLVRGAALQRARMLPGKPLGFHMPEPVQGLLHSVRLHKGSLEERGTVVFRVGLSLECGVRGASGATSGERGGRPTPSHREAPRTPAHGNSRYLQLRAPYSAPAHAMREPTLNTAYPFTKESGVVPPPRVSRVERGRGCAEGACACVLEGERRGRIRNTP